MTDSVQPKGTDLLERLGKDWRVCPQHPEYRLIPHALLREAAEEIERLTEAGRVVARAEQRFFDAARRNGDQANTFEEMLRAAEQERDALRDERDTLSRQLHDLFGATDKPCPVEQERDALRAALTEMERAYVLLMPTDRYDDALAERAQRAISASEKEQSV